MNKQSFAALLFVLAFSKHTDAAELYRGIYVWGSERETFSPCGGDKAWWVKADEAQLLRLRQAYQQASSQPYAGIYVELVGEFAKFTSEDDGFALQYEGMFALQAIQTITAKSSLGC